MSNWDRQVAKMLPLRFLFAGLCMGATSLYYITKSHEINRIKRMAFSMDLMANVGVRSLIAGAVADLVGRKLFVNEDRLTAHKVATNEVKKVMRTYPNARPMLMPH